MCRSTALFGINFLLQSHGPSAASEKKGASDSVEELTRQIADCAVIRLVPEDDKVAVLEARIRQQSELIALLKQRADSTLHQVSLGHSTYTVISRSFEFESVMVMRKLATYIYFHARIVHYSIKIIKLLDCYYM